MRRRLARQSHPRGYGVAWRLIQSNCFTVATLVKLERTKAKAPRKRPKKVEGANQKKNGKWSNPLIFPGREFDHLDAYRAAKEQRAAQRDEYRAQARDNGDYR